MKHMRKDAAVSLIKSQAAAKESDLAAACRKDGVLFSASM